uniref:EF-hand domain-containing protein n=1 Tax=Wuchereria bancrofti TaxID=6293 RepID=A0AAF5PYP1_WUCBA
MSGKENFEMCILMLFIILPNVPTAVFKSITRRDCKLIQPIQPVEFLRHLFQEIDIDKDKRLNLNA